MHTDTLPSPRLPPQTRHFLYPISLFSPLYDLRLFLPIYDYPLPKTVTMSGYQGRGRGTGGGGGRGDQRSESRGRGGYGGGGYGGRGPLDTRDATPAPQE